MLRRFLLFSSVVLPLCAQSVVEGTVIESVSKTPVLDATVQIRYTKPPNGVSSMSVQNTGPSTQTDGAGRFRIEVASPSEFRFVIGKDGYSPVDSSDSRVIVLTKGESKRGLC